jgi:phage terminase small subunit
MRGRPVKPLGVKLRDGSRIREDRINREAPTPRLGRVIPTSKLSDAERTIWRRILTDSAPGHLTTLDSGLLRRYCWSYAALLSAFAIHQAWCDVKDKKPGENNLLQVASNGVLGSHPILGVIDKLQAQVSKQEEKLGFTPVDRERIHASIQAELYPGQEDPWQTFDKHTQDTQ